MVFLAGKHCSILFGFPSGFFWIVQGIVDFLKFVESGSMPYFQSEGSSFRGFRWVQDLAMYC
jgi:hypothetical protein